MVYSIGTQAFVGHTDDNVKYEDGLYNKCFLDAEKELLVLASAHNQHYLL